MVQPVRYGPLLALLLLIWAAGCGDDRPELQSQTPVSDPMSTGMSRMDRSPPGDAVEAVKLALASLRDGRLEAAYDFLPGSFQNDIDALAQAFAGRMDPELWEALFRLLGKSVDVLKTQEDLVRPLVQPWLSPGGGASPQAAERLSDQWGTLVAALELLLDSDLADLNRLQQLSLRRFLAKTGNRVFAMIQELDESGMHRLDELASATVEQVPTTDGTVRLRIQFPGEPQATEQDFTAVDGRWIPVALAEHWPEQVQTLQDHLARLTPARIAALKPEALKQMQAVERALDAMRAARQPEEFFAAISPLLQALQELRTTLDLRNAPAGSVVITLEGHLADPEETRLISELVQLTDQPSRAEYTATRTGGYFRISLTHVADVEAFASRLNYPGRKIVNAAARSIHLRPE